MKTPFEVMCKQAPQFRDVVRLVEKSANAPLHELIAAAVSRGPDLTFELFQIALSDLSQFRLESEAEIDAMLLRAIEARAA